MSAEGMDHPSAAERVRRNPWVAALLSVLLPGAGQLYVGRRRRGLVLLSVTALLVALAVAWVAADPIAVAKLAFDPGVLRGLLVIDGAVLAFRVWAAWDAFRDASPGSVVLGRMVAVLAALAAGALLVVPHAWFAYYDLTQLDLITSVFAAPAPTSTLAAPATTTSAPPTTPPVGESSTPPPPTTTTTTTTQPPTIWNGATRVNILLLGSDAGVGRSGTRTDTIILFSIDPATGDAALLSVPRNFARVPLPESVGIWDCDCFPPIINELYDFGERNPDAFPGSIPPGATALKGAIGELLGIPVHFYALVALDGFVDIVDALGGVTITVTERVYDSAYPKEGGGSEVIDFQPGVRDFDGHEALAYARSRQSSDDYSRIGRQRCVLEALAAQTDPITLLRGFPALADAIKRSVETDIPLDSVPDLIELAGRVDTDRAFSIQLVPPAYVSGRTAEGYSLPNLDLIREHAGIATELPAARAMALLGIDPLATACGE